MSSHAFLPPSGAHSWSKCALWAKMNELYPQPESAEALEGTAAHWVGWEILSNRDCNEGISTPNGQIVTDEMLDGGQLLADTIRLRMQIFGMQIHVEEKVIIPVASMETFGTPDCWGISTDGRHIEIVDYKFGHRFVDEYFNPQGIAYLKGIIELLCKLWNIGPGLIDQYGLTVSFTVVQPRCFYKGSPVRTHTFALSEARPYFNLLDNMAASAMMPEPTATTNEHCGYCPGRHACQALQQASYSDAEFATNRSPLDLTPEAAGLELRLLTRALERLEARVDGLKETTLSNLRAGKSVPYFHLEQGYGRATWNLPEKQVISMGAMFGKDLSKPSVITPNQARKLGIDESVINAYSFIPATSFKLVADNPADARKVFGQPQEK